MAEEVLLKSKEAFYRGKPVEELKKLDVREAAKYLPSRSKRSVLRSFQSVEKFIKRCEESTARNKKIKTHLRDMVIVPHLVGMNIQVHTGKIFSEVRVTAAMIGHRLGEFALTREKVTHGNPGLGATKSSAGEKK